MLAVDGVEVAYGPVRALRGVSLQVGRGEIVSVVGPNGAGKSTLLLTIAGALRPRAGEIRLDDDPIAGRPAESLARRGISLVPEGRNIFAQLTVRENLRLGSQMRRDRERIEQDFADMLTVFPVLRERLSSPGGKLSGGEQQQLAIARALMTGARFIMLDEPALGLAPMMVETVYDVLHKLRKERALTLLIVEQSTHRALENADRIYLLRQGLIELAGPSSELDEAAVERAYFGYDR